VSAEDIMNAQFLEQAHEPPAAPYVTPDEVARYLERDGEDMTQTLQETSMEVVATEYSQELIHLVRSAIEACIRHGLTPMRASRQVYSDDALRSDDRYLLATVGLGRLVSEALRERNRPVAGTAEHHDMAGAAKDRAETARARQEQRRVALYRKVTDVLDALYQGSDGQMRTLARFSLADHESRLVECESQGASWCQWAGFHREALLLLKDEAVDSISALSKASKARLREKLI
jgi:hypothetical protein